MFARNYFYGNFFFLLKRKRYWDSISETYFSWILLKVDFHREVLPSLKPIRGVNGYIVVPPMPKVPYIYCRCTTYGKVQAHTKRLDSCFIIIGTVLERETSYPDVFWDWATDLYIPLFERQQKKTAEWRLKWNGLKKKTKEKKNKFSKVRVSSNYGNHSELKTPKNK